MGKKGISEVAGCSCRLFSAEILALPWIPKRFPQPLCLICKMEQHPEARQGRSPLHTRSGPKTSFPSDAAPAPRPPSSRSSPPSPHFLPPPDLPGSRLPPVPRLARSRNVRSRLDVCSQSEPGTKAAGGRGLPAPRGQPLPPPPTPHRAAALRFLPMSHWTSSQKENN